VLPLLEPELEPGCDPELEPVGEPELDPDPDPDPEAVPELAPGSPPTLPSLLEHPATPSSADAATPRTRSPHCLIRDVRIETPLAAAPRGRRGFVRTIY
jgi:hypothetical protein